MARKGRRYTANYKWVPAVVSYLKKVGVACSYENIINNATLTSPPFGPMRKSMIRPNKISFSKSVGYIKDISRVGTAGNYRYKYEKREW
jgi:hypothetical protein